MPRLPVEPQEPLRSQAQEPGTGLRGLRNLGRDFVEDHAGTGADVGEEDLERLDGSAENFPCGVPKPFDG